MRQNHKKNEVAAPLQAKIKAKQLRVIIDVEPNVPRSLFGDAVHLKQVLLNICGNAVKYTHHGEVRVSVCLQEAASGLVGLRFKVSDKRN